MESKKSSNRVKVQELEEDSDLDDSVKIVQKKEKNIIKDIME